MKIRNLGVASPLSVSAIGLGCMGMSHGYGAPSDIDEMVRLIRTAHDLGVTFSTQQKSTGPIRTRNLSEKLLNRYATR